MAKISAKKLIKRIESLKGNMEKDDNYFKYYNGYMRAANEIIYFIEDMQTKAERKKADKDVGGWRHRQLERNIAYAYAIRSVLPQTSAILSSGKGKKIYSVGETIPIMYLGKPVDFDIVEVADHGIKLISHDILAFQPFNINDSNVYDKSSIKDYLENEFEKCFDTEFIKLLNGNKFHLPSEDEIINAYPEKEQRVKRYKNEIYWYWTGTPNASTSSGVRYVGTDGVLYYRGAYYAGGLAAACIIGRLD